MGKYSYIQYSRLRDAANTALSELATYGLNDIKSTLNNSGVLPGEIKKNVTKNIEKVIDDKSINGTLGLLEYNLKKLVNVMNKVEMYQSKEDEYDNFKRSMDDDDPSDRKKLARLKRELEKSEEAVTNELNKKRGNYFWND